MRFGCRGYPRAASDPIRNYDTRSVQNSSRSDDFEPLADALMSAPQQATIQERYPMRLVRNHAISTVQAIVTAEKAKAAP